MALMAPDAPTSGRLDAGSIAGTVTTLVDGAPEPVADAAVTAFLGNDEISTTATDEFGAYVLSALLAGDYRLEVSATGFEDAEVASVVLGDAEDKEDVDVELTAEP